MNDMSQDKGLLCKDIVVFWPFLAFILALFEESAKVLNLIKYFPEMSRKPNKKVVYQDTRRKKIIRQVKIIGLRLTTFTKIYTVYSLKKYITI